jgi:hypothetical protein
MSIFVATWIDPSTGHCHPPTPHKNLPASGGKISNVFVGNANIVTQADVYTPTTCGDTAHAPTVLPIAGATVFAGSLPVAKLGDPLSCGDTVGAVGAFNVYAY